MAKWKTIPNEIPTNTQLVYVRLWNYFNSPILCNYDESSQAFVTVTNNIIFPIYTVYRWLPA
jgi:hypothetical protein